MRMPSISSALDDPERARPTDAHPLDEKFRAGAVALGGGRSPPEPLYGARVARPPRRRIRCTAMRPPATRSERRPSPSPTLTSTRAELTAEPISFSAAEADVPQAHSAEGWPNGTDVDRQPALARGLLGAPADQRSKTEADQQHGEKAGSGDRQEPSVSPARGDELQRSEGQAAFPHAGPPLSIGW